MDENEAIAKLGPVRKCDEVVDRRIFLRYGKRREKKIKMKEL